MLSNLYDYLKGSKNDEEHSDQNNDDENDDQIVENSAVD